MENCFEYAMRMTNEALAKKPPKCIHSGSRTIYDAKRDEWYSTPEICDICDKWCLFSREQNKNPKDCPDFEEE